MSQSDPAPDRSDALKAKGSEAIIPAPQLPCGLPKPVHYRPKIGLIGCGGITPSHLRAYRAAGWEVVAFCSRTAATAEARRDEFYPDARVFTDYHELLALPEVDVVDISLHPVLRVAVIEAALLAGKHVLSQKPFVLDLDEGERLVALAKRCGRHLAVNQNGRWAPYFNFLHQAVRAGCIGQVQSVVMTLNWDHSWIEGTPFEQVQDVVLYDFGIHWFDMAASFFQGRVARSVFAVNAAPADQKIKPPLLGSALVTFDGGVAALHFNAHSRFGARESICLTGSAGTLRAEGAICAAHDVTLFTAEGVAHPVMEGNWFDDGFRGTMGELLSAIEENREPSNTAASALPGLALCFAAVESARSGRPMIPGQVRILPSE
jgi:predicted dehydrogenase